MESGLDLHLPSLAVRQASGAMGAAVHSISSLRCSSQSQGSGKVWVFGGAVVLTMSGPFLILALGPLIKLRFFGFPSDRVAVREWD